VVCANSQCALKHPYPWVRYGFDTGSRAKKNQEETNDIYLNFEHDFMAGPRARSSELSGGSMCGDYAEFTRLRYVDEDDV